MISLNKWRRFRDELKSTDFSIVCHTLFCFEIWPFLLMQLSICKKRCNKPCLHYIKIVRSIYCMLLANWKTIKVKHCRWEKMLSSINDPAPLYNLRQNLQTLQHQKGMTQIQHPRQYKSKINYDVHVHDIVHKMKISTSISLLITCICYCQFDAGISISIRLRILTSR